MPQNSTGIIGPGEYSDSFLNSNENITQNIIPFNSKTERISEFAEHNNSKIGPGYYYQSKYSSFIKNSFGKFNDRANKMGKSGLFDLALYRAINRKKTMKIKEKESLKIDKSNKNQVFNSSNVVNKNNISNIESKNIFSNKKIALVPTTLTKNRVSSIPSKNFYLGYNLDNSGYLTMVNPSSLENEKNKNSIKNINNKNYRNISSYKSKINGLDWSKMSKKIMYTDRISTIDNSNIHSNRKTNNNSSNINNYNNNSINENNIKKSNLTTISAYNAINKTNNKNNTLNYKANFTLIHSTSNNSIGNNNESKESFNEQSEISTLNKIYRSLSEETLTNIKHNKVKGILYKTNNKNNHSKFMDYMSLEEYVYDNLFNAEPGPGYYKEKSDFDKYLYLTKNKKVKYNFGSNTERKYNSFSNSKNSFLGPGCYFKEDNTPKKIHNFHPFNKKENIKNLKRIQKNFCIDNLGPGKYDIKSQFEKTLKYYSGPLEKRFFNKEKKTPGPGEYIQLYNWNDQNKDTNTKMFQFLTNTENKFKKENLKEDQGRQCYIPKKDNPCVGDYNPHLLKSINYEIISKDNKISDLIAPFYSGQEKFPKKCASTSDLLGPGYYFPKKDIKIVNKKEKKLNQKILNDIFKAEIIKFSYNQNKNDMITNLGPGSYERDNYRDWNKKSFNALYA